MAQKESGFKLRSPRRTKPSLDVDGSQHYPMARKKDNKASSSFKQLLKMASPTRRKKEQMLREIVSPIRPPFARLLTEDDDDDDDDYDDRERSLSPRTEDKKSTSKSLLTNLLDYLQESYIDPNEEQYNSEDDFYDTEDNNMTRIDASLNRMVNWAG